MIEYIIYGAFGTGAAVGIGLEIRGYIKRNRQYNELQKGDEKIMNCFKKEVIKHKDLTLKIQ